MKKQRTVAGFLLCLMCGSAALAQDSRAAIIQRLEDELNVALGRVDTAALDRLWGEELSFVTQNGALTTKAQRLASLKSSPPATLVSVNESVDSKFYGSVAVAIVVSRWDLTVDGKPVATRFRATHVWVEREGRWQLIAAQVAQMKG
jgi:hypothetical protein